jgi:ribonuclease D
LTGPEERPLRFLDAEAEEFNSFLDSLASEPRLALDLESDPYHRYFEKVCLLQISTPSADYFFDPLAFGMPEALHRLLSDSDRLLVLHGADYDVRALKKGFDLSLGRLFDTSIAAQILGLPEIGLKPLLEKELGIIIDKGEQRSDWSKRPLTASQLEYARQDSRHLLPLSERLREKLDAAGRTAWVEEECALLRRRSPIEKKFDPEEWKNVKGAKALGEIGRKVLRAAFVWREDVAQMQDVPPFRIMRNDVLLRLAQWLQRDRRQVRRLDRIRFLPELDLDSLSRALETAISAEDPLSSEQAKHAADQPKAPKKGEPHLDKEARARLDRLRSRRAEWSSLLKIDAGFLISGTVLRRVASTNPQNVNELAQIEGMTDWRIGALGSQILEALRL